MKFIDGLSPGGIAVIMLDGDSLKASAERMIDEKAALDWLYMREKRLGATFAREGCSASGYGVVRAGKGPAGDISFAAIDYEGVLEVTDPARLHCTRPASRAFQLCRVDR
jgi:hypothetical protein